MRQFSQKIVKRCSTYIEGLVDIEFYNHRVFILWTGYLNCLSSMLITTTTAHNQCFTFLFHVLFFPLHFWILSIFTNILSTNKGGGSLALVKLETSIRTDQMRSWWAKMGQWMKGLATKAEDLSSIPGSHKVKEEM